MTQTLAGAIIDSAKHIAVSWPHVCSFVDAEFALEQEWETAENYLAWAMAEFGRGNQHGYDASLTYAKRAVCRRIDGFIFYNHLKTYEGEDYPGKMELLQKLGIPVRDIVHDLVITPRNNSEHSYLKVSEQAARHAVELAEMFLDSTKEEAKRAAVVALNWNLPGNFFEAPKPIQEFKDCDMVLVDIFQQPEKVNVVRPRDATVEFAELGVFTKDELIEFAQWLRTKYLPAETNFAWNAGAYRMMLQAAKI
jgi:hypothetical protein